MTTRARIDWDAAFGWYAAHDPGTRRYPAVARQFQCTNQAVKKAAKRLDWDRRLADLDEQARRRTDSAVVRSRTQRVQDTIRIAQKARLRFERQLDNDEPVSGHEVAQLIKLEQLVEGEATDRVEASEVNAAIGDVVQRAVSALRRLDPAAAEAFLADLQADDGEAAA